jgi:hypothetical protein
MTVHWRLGRDGTVVTGREAADLLRRRANEGVLETWLIRDDGPVIGIVTNGSRAMVVWMAEPGDPGRHAVDPGAGEGRGDGYRLGNGQVDRYADRDTVPFALARRIVTELLDSGTTGEDVNWHDDGD